MDTRRCPVGNERYDCSEIGLPGADICFGNLRKGCLWTLSSCTGPHLAPRLLVVTQVYNYEQTRMMLQYCAFTQTEGAHEGGTKWPAFRPVGRGSVLSAPSYQNLETYCDHKFAEVRVQLGVGVFSLFFGCLGL